MQDTPIALIAVLESAESGTALLDERMQAMLSGYKTASTPRPTQSLDQAIAAIPEYYWWQVERRKNMPNFHMPNPANGRHTFLAHIGLHSHHTTKGNKRGAVGRGHTPATALCAALINATQIEMRKI